MMWGGGFSGCTERFIQVGGDSEKLGREVRSGLGPEAGPERVQSAGGHFWQGHSLAEAGQPNTEGCVGEQDWPCGPGCPCLLEGSWEWRLPSWSLGGLGPLPASLTQFIILEVGFTDPHATCLTGELEGRRGQRLMCRQRVPGLLMPL